MKRVVFVAQGLSNGGSEKVSSMIANHLVNIDYRVKFICVFNSEREYHIDEKILVSTIVPKGKISLIRHVNRNMELYREIVSFKPNIVISFIVTESIVLAELKGISVVLSLRNDPKKSEKNFFARILRLFAFKHAGKVVFQTAGAKKYFKKQIQKNSVVIPNPIDVKKLPYWIENKHNKTFVTLCRLNIQKNIPLLIKAFVKVHSYYPDYSLEIYGEGELKQTLAELINNYKADHYIFLKGHTPNAYAVLAECFAFCMSSDYEGLSNSMLEALSIGTPCLCTDCPPGGARDFIIDGVNGLLSPVGESDMFAQKMIQLIENKCLRFNLSNSSVNIRKKLDEEVICNQWQLLLEELLRR